MFIPNCNKHLKGERCHGHLVALSRTNFFPSTHLFLIVAQATVYLISEERGFPQSLLLLVRDHTSTGRVPSTWNRDLHFHYSHLSYFTKEVTFFPMLNST